MLRNITAAIALTLAVLPASLVFSSVSVFLTNKDLATQADEIVLGTVKDKRSVLDEKEKKPYTLTTITVKEWIKGQGGAEIVIRQLGGKIGDRTMAVTGDARMEVGEEVMLFLRKGEGVRYLLAMSQSKFSVCWDGTAGKKIIKRELGDLSVGQFDKDGNFRFVQEKAESPVTLDAFIAEIKGYIQVKSR